jgi:hypothetical protein
LNLYRAMTCGVLSIALAACCGSNESAVSEARALTQARLGQLVRDVESLGKNVRFEKHEIPAQFRDLKLHSIISRGDAVFLHLSGCMDDKVHLVVRRGDVALTLGEAKGRQLLFQSTAGAP